MTILAVIPCLNEVQHLPALLDQFLAEDAITHLIVADGGSTDGSRELVSSRAKGNAKLVLLDNPARIQSAGINRAVAAYGQGLEWLLRIDAHCGYPDVYAGKLLAAAQSHSAGSVVVPMVTRAHGGFQQAVAVAQNSALGTGGSPHRHLMTGRYVDHGHHALMDLGLFRKAGGYCEAMPCNEDAELDHRLGLLGCGIWLEPRAALEYYPRRTLASLARQYFRYGVGRARTLRRHRLSPKPRQMLPVAAALAVVVAPLCLFYWPFALPALTWLCACLAYGLVIGLKAGGGWSLLAGVAAATMHLAWGLGFLAEFLSGAPSPKAKLGFSAAPSDN